MKCVIQDTQIFGPVSLFSHYADADTILIEKHENYQKRSFRNRYDILMSGGKKTLSIPLCKGKNRRMVITDVLISYDENWIGQHLQSIRSSYGKSPFFEFYFGEIENIFKKKHSHLFTLNDECLRLVLKKLKLNIGIEYTDSYIEQYPGFLDMRNSGGLDKLNLPVYTQVWAEKFDFTPNLSILDLLFCTGPESTLFLKQQEIKM